MAQIWLYSGALQLRSLIMIYILSFFFDFSFLHRASVYLPRAFITILHYLHWAFVYHTTPSTAHHHGQSISINFFVLSSNLHISNNPWYPFPWRYCFASQQLLARCSSRFQLQRRTSFRKRSQFL